ncbi:MAG: hypothetical protein RIC55_11980 [Pirellulaceae bacterium]
MVIWLLLAASATLAHGPFDVGSQALPEAPTSRPSADHAACQPWLRAGIPVDSHHAGVRGDHFDGSYATTLLSRGKAPTSPHRRTADLTNVLGKRAPQGRQLGQILSSPLSAGSLVTRQVRLQI